MTLLDVLDYLAKYREDTEESAVLLERLSPILLSRPYLLERAVAEAWAFFDESITKVCVDHAIEIAKIDAAIAASEADVADDDATPHVPDETE